MPLYTVTGPDGREYSIEGPEGATEAQVQQAVAFRLMEQRRQEQQSSLDELYAQETALRAQEVEEEAGLGENILSGLGAGAVGIFETAALGAATLLEEGNELEARRIIQEAADAITPEGGDKEAISYQIAQGVGSILGFAPTALLGPAALPAAAALGVGVGVGEASERAREEGTTQEERDRAAALGIIPGALEVTPLGRVFKALRVPFVQDLVDKLGPEAVQGIGSRIKNASVTGGVEGAQEVASETLQNLIESGYNPDQSIVEGLDQAAGIGFSSGAIVQLMVDVFAGRKGPAGAEAPTEEGPQQGELFTPEEAPAGVAPTTPATREEQLDLFPEERAAAEAEAPQTEELSPVDENQLDMFAEELGLTPEQIAEAKEAARQTQLFEGDVPSADVEPRLPAPPSETELAERGDFEEIARRRTETARAERGERLGAQEQAIEEARVREAQEAERDRQIAEAALPQVEEQARRRIGDEQEMFPLDRERAEAKPEPTRLTRPQQGELEGLGTAEEAETSRQERDARRQREEQTEMFGPRGGIPRRVPSVTPETRLPTQGEMFTEEQLAEAGRPPIEEQGELLGPRGGPRTRAEFEAREPDGGLPATGTREVSTEPKPVTKTIMSDLGIPPAAPVRKRIEGRDMANPTDAEFVRQQLTDFSANPNVTEGTKFKITKFLEGTPDGQLEMFDARARVREEAKAPQPETAEGQADVQPERVRPEPSGVGVQTGEPSPRRGRTGREPTRAERTPTPEPERLESAGRDVADVASRERAEPSTLEEKPKPKAKPKAKRPTAAETLAKVKPLPKTKTKPKAEPKAEPKKEEAVKGPARVAMTRASEADQKLREAQDKAVTNPLSALFNYNFRKVGRSVAKDTDKTTVASLLERVADPIKSKLNKKEPKNAARFYFSKKSRIEDTLELIAHDLAFGGMGKSSYQATTRGNLGQLAELEDVTSTAENTFFEGLGNAEVARAAQSWIVGNMSPEVIKKLQQRASHYAEMALNIDNMKGRDLIAEERALDAARDKLQGKIRKQATKKDEKLDKKLTRELEQAFEEGVDAGTVEYIDLMDQLAVLKYDLDLPSDAVAASSMPLHPEVSVALDAGNLGKALQYIASTTLNTRVRNAAEKLAGVIGTTKVKVADKLDAAGKFDPKTNTITINADTGMNVHTVLHETAHAATSATLANPSHPMTKQLTKLFNDVKDMLDTAYGSTNLDEFVAETFSNPEFRAKLAGLTPKGAEITALQRFNNAVMNFMRKLFGMQTKPIDSALSEADMMIENILAPSPESRNAGELLLTLKQGPQAVRDFVNNYGSNLNTATKAIRDGVSKSDFLSTATDLLTGDAKVYGKVKAIGLKFLPSQAFADVLNHFKVTKGMQLHKLFEDQEGAMNNSDTKLDGMLKLLNDWSNKPENRGERKAAFDKIVHDSTIEQVDPSKPRSAYANNAEKLKAYDAMQAKWNSLDAEGKKLYQDLRDTYKDMYMKMKQVIEGRLDNLTDEDGNPVSPEAKTQLKNEVFSKLFEQGNIEPYFPLTRQGDFWLSYNFNDGTSTEPVVRAFASNAERKAAIAELNAMPEVSDVEIFANQSEINFSKAPTSSFVSQTLRLLDRNNVGKDVKEEFLRLFIETLPETSFAKSLQKRKNTAGYNEDAVLAFRLKAYDIGRQTVRLEYSQRIRRTMDEIDVEIGNNAELRNTDLANILREEVLVRGNFAMNPPADVFAQMARSANRFAFLGTIGFNLSSAIVNLSQVPLVVLPFMAGKTNINSALSNTKAAMKFYAGSGTEHAVNIKGKQVKTKGVPSIDNYYEMNDDGKLSMRTDLELDAEQKKVVENMLPLVQAATERGLLNRSMFYDTLGNETSGKAKSTLDLISAWSAFPFHTAERFNRQISLTANYLNELERLNNNPNRAKGEHKLSNAEKQQLAVDTALYDTQQTNGGAVLATAPRIAQIPLGRVAMMYKTFGIQMYYTQLKTAKEALKDADPYVRKQAFRQIVGVQLSVLMMSGVQGLTAYGIAVAIADMFLDDDEPDAETIVRQYLGEGLYKGGVNAALAAAGLEVDVAARIGLSNLIIQSNRYNFDPSMEKSIVSTLGGPFYGYTSQMVRGVNDVLDGELQRGVENMLPAAFRNASKTLFRYSEEGIRTRRGDPILDDLSMGELAAQFVGFAPAEYTLTQERNQVLKRIEKSVNNQSTKLLRQYYIAQRTGDREAVIDAMEEIRKFNKKHPNAAIGIDTIKRSMAQHMRTSATMYNGVTLSPKLRAELQALGDAYDRGPQFLE